MRLVDFIQEYAEAHKEAEAAKKRQQDAIKQKLFVVKGKKHARGR